MSFPNANPRIVITCGPSYEPLDQVRRLTNFSSGELGIVLANAFVKKGFHVLCFKGAGATTQLSAPGAEIVAFHTNEDLLGALENIADKESVSAVFHAAALCDFKVAEVRSLANEELGCGKISSRAGEIQITLRPAVKLISHLRQIFSSSMIVGWKYEVEGLKSDALEKGRTQIKSNQLDACVVNGPAFGPGFGYLDNLGSLLEVPTKIALSRFLLERVGDFELRSR